MAGLSVTGKWRLPRSTATSGGEGEPPGSGHGGFMAEDPYAFQVAHRRLAWLLRLSAGTNLVLGFCLASAMSTVSVLVPLKTTEVALVRTNTVDDKLYRIEPISQDVDGFQLLMESTARRYVRLLIEIDRVTQRERFDEVQTLTDNKFYEKFRKERIETKAFADAINSLVRTVLVESVTRVDSYRGTHKYAVDFTQIDTRNGEEIERKRITAYLDMTTRPHEVPEADKYTNPLGITVLDLVLKERTGT
jgi:type IV secretion system protein VirB8